MPRETSPPPPPPKKKYRTIKQGLEKLNFGASKPAIRGSRAPAPLIIPLESGVGPKRTKFDTLPYASQFPYPVQKGPSSTLLHCLVLCMHLGRRL